jgi:hypothetical protein
MNEDTIKEEHEHNYKLLTELRRRLRAFELQQIKLGLTADPSVAINIEDTKKQIDFIEKKDDLLAEMEVCHHKVSESIMWLHLEVIKLGKTANEAREIVKVAEHSPDELHKKLASNAPIHDNIDRYFRQIKRQMAKIDKLYEQYKKM